MSKPLSEKEWREKIAIFIESGVRAHVAHNTTPNEAHKALFESELESIKDMVINLIFQDRKAWGEYVIGTSSLSMVMSPAIRLKNGHIDTSWTDEHDKYKAAYIEDGLRAEQRQRNTSGRNK